MVWNNSKRKSCAGSTAWRSLAPASQLAPINEASASTYSTTQQQPSAPAASAQKWVPLHKRAGSNLTASKMDETTENFGKMKIRGQPTAFPWDASQAPKPAPVAPSMLTCHFAETGKANTMLSVKYSDGDRKKWVKTAVCVQSPWSRKTFNKGDVISLPYHEANMNPNCPAEDPGLRFSEFGPVLSKRRMVLILFKYKQTMFCVPLYTFGDRGIKCKPEAVQDEYIQLMNVGDDEQKFEGKGKHKPVSFKHAWTNGSLKDTTTIHITGGRNFSWQEDIELVGRLSRERYYRLIQLWRKFNKEAEDEDCAWPY